MGIIVGVVFTAIIQSSSAATVMVVSFVNAGLMTLYQAIGVIYGANIGTTVTSQLVSFNLSQYARYFIMGRRSDADDLQESNGEKSRRGCHRFWYPFPGNQYHVFFYGCFEELPAIQNLFMSLDNRFFALLLGLMITAIVQSSSVTVSIVLLFGTAGITSAEDLFSLLFSDVISVPACQRCLPVSAARRMPNVQL